MDNQNSITTNPNQPIIQPQSKKSLKAWPIVILSLLALIGCCFGIYGMFFKPESNGQTSPSSAQSGINGDSSAETGPDAYVARDLRNKTFRLLGYRSGLSIHDSYNSEQNTFIILHDYMPIKQLLDNSLTETMKVYIALETTVLGKEKYCSYEWTDGVKADIDSAMQSYPYGGQGAIGFGNTIECISYDDADRDYLDLFGGNMPKLNGLSDTLTGGDFAYGANLNAYYYHIVGGRGGTTSNYIVGRINQISEASDYAYIDINIGALKVGISETGAYLYSDVEGNNLYKDFGGADFDWKDFELTEEDYSSFQSYRFAYRKNASGIYSFSNVEKI